MQPISRKNETRPTLSDRFDFGLDGLDSLRIECQIGVCVFDVCFDFGHNLVFAVAFTDTVTAIDDAFYLL